MHAAFQGKVTCWAASLLHCIPTETCPKQSELHSYVLICIFTDRSQQLHNQNNQNTWFQPIRPVLFEPIKQCKFRFLIFYKIGPIGLGQELYKNRPPLCLGGVQFQFPPKAAFSGLETLPEWSFSFYRTPNWGFLLALDWWQQHLLTATFVVWWVGKKSVVRVGFFSLLWSGRSYLACF